MSADVSDRMSITLPGQPGAAATTVVGRHLIRAIATRSAGRPRFCVVCLTCRTLIHEGTTGPEQWAAVHVREAAAEPSGAERFIDRMTT